MPRRAVSSWPRQVHPHHRQVPMRREALEAVLLLPPERLLIGEQPLELGVGERLVRRRRVLPYDRDTIVPAAVLSRVKARRLRGHLLRVAELDLAFQYREMILLEESDELVRVAPADLVVVLHHERLGRAGRWRLGHAGCRRRHEQRENRITQHVCLLVQSRLRPSVASACPNRACGPWPPWARSPRGSSPGSGCGGSNRGGTPRPGKTPRAALPPSRSEPATTFRA